MSAARHGTVSGNRIEELLRSHTAPAAAALVEKLDGGRLRCLACAHRCPIAPGHSGVCRVRFHRDGELRVPWGYVSGLQADPVEKKPFYHAWPGAVAMSFGMLGCDLHCAYCQNWLTSQTLRDPGSIAPLTEATPDAIVHEARRHGARILASTYNEPLITSEWAVAVFQKAKTAGLACAFVSNGHATPEVLEFLRPWVDLYKVDLKSFKNENYRRLGGRLPEVLHTIERLPALGFWLEVVTLLVPDFNDGDDELRDMARFLAGISRDIPWHITAFHPDYQMNDRDATGATRLLRAAEIGREAGLRYVYAGNLPGGVGRHENTFCPGCGDALIERRGFRVLANRLKDGRCPRCATPIPGRW